MADDDDIDRLVQEIRKLIKTLSAGLGAANEETGKVEGVDDMWDVGELSPNVRSMEEYIRERIIAASSEDVAIPLLDSDAFSEEIWKVYLALYLEGHEHLDAIYNRLSKDDFKRFLQELVIVERFPDIQKDELRDLMVSIDPSTQIMGASTRKDRVDIISDKVWFNVMSAYDSYWYVPEDRVWQGPKPWETFQNALDRLNEEEFDIIQSPHGIDYITQQLVDMAQRRDMEVSEDFSEFEDSEEEDEDGWNFGQ